MSYSQEQIILEKGWRYKNSNDTIWKKCKIPNSIFNILFSDSLIQNPFYSNNEESLQSVGRASYQFKTEFQINDQFFENSKQVLILNGIDTYADIYLNEKRIQTCDNAFRSWNINIKEFLQVGKNEILIDFHSAEIESQKRYNQLNPVLPGGERVMTRKPQYHFGWDFGPKFIGCGIMDIPKINSYSTFRIIHHSIQTTKLNQYYADIELVLEIDSEVDEKKSIQWSLDNQIFSNTLQLKKGINYYRSKQKLKNPKLWWPNGSGDTYLYNTRIIFSDKHSNIIKNFKTGIRKIDLINKKDKWGTSFYFQVNGVPVFAKGANYIPQSIFQDRTHNHIQILQDAKDCNFNMIRVWGGGNYESDSFYEACDRLGIMVWQDFMYACAMYPGDNDFLNNARIEADEQVKRLSRFASIALWCGNNENNEAWHRWGWQIGLSSDTKEKFWNDYKKLFLEILPTSVSTFSNQNLYWESSPLFGRGDKRFLTEGDAHDWGVWHDEMNFESFEQRVPRFMSEAGFQSLPTLTTVRSFAPEEQLNLESKSLLSHQKHPRGNKLINDYLQRDLPTPKNFEELIYLNQLNQAEGIGLGIKAHRRAKPYCMGTLYWQFNDCWPGISWSSRDYYGRWKALQHKTKELYQPILLTVRESDEVVEIFASSDYLEEVKITARIKLIILDKEELIDENIEIKLNSNYSGRIFSFDLKKYKKQFDAKNAILYFEWNYKNQKSYALHFFEKLKNVNLLNPKFNIENINKTNQGFEFDLSSDQFAKAAYIKEDDLYSFFPNFLDLAPGRKVRILCKTSLPEIGNIKINSLYDYLNQ